jgi:hypothetical protein
MKHIGSIMMVGAALTACSSLADLGDLTPDGSVASVGGSASFNTGGTLGDETRSTGGDTMSGGGTTGIPTNTGGDTMSGGGTTGIPTNTGGTTSIPGVWTSCGDPEAPGIEGMRLFMAQSKMGDACASFGGCGIGDEQEGCLGQYRNCLNEVLYALTLEHLDCPVVTPSADSWSDCLLALQGGHSGDTCSWEGACLRPSTQTCCVELAMCGSPVQQLYRARICAPGCTEISADPSQPTVTSCAGTSVGLNINLGAPCQGSFICTGGQDATGHLQATSADIAWCDHGMVVGGTFMPWPNR